MKKVQHHLLFKGHLVNCDVAMVMYIPIKQQQQNPIVQVKLYHLQNTIEYTEVEYFENTIFVIISFVVLQIK